MRYYPEKTKVIRFDVDYGSLKLMGKSINGILNGIPMIEDISPSETKGNLWVGMTWRFNVFSPNEDKKEVVGYLAENNCCLIDFTDKNADIPILEMFVANSFLETQKLIRDRIPTLSDISLSRDQCRFYAFGLMIQVVDKRVYI